MRKTILILFVLLLAAHAHGGWFDNGEKERRIQTEQQLLEQRKATGTWQAVSFVLGIGCVVAVVIRTIIGSRARRDAGTNH